MNIGHCTAESSFLELVIPPVCIFENESLYLYSVLTISTVLLCTVITFQVGGVLQGDHSVIRPDQFGEDSDALHCITSYQFCCRAADDPLSSMAAGHWIAPDGSGYGPINFIPSLYVLRDLSRVSLSRPSSITPQSGIYQCQIPGADGSMETLHIGLYPDGAGGY